MGVSFSNQKIRAENSKMKVPEVFFKMLQSSSLMLTNHSETSTKDVSEEVAILQSIYIPSLVRLGWIRRGALRREAGEADAGARREYAVFASFTQLAGREAGKKRKKKLPPNAPLC